MDIGLQPIRVSGLTRAAETTIATGTGIEFVNNVERDLHDRDNDKLRQAVERVEREAFLAAIPGRHHDFALIVGVDQPYGYAPQKLSQICE